MKTFKITRKGFLKFVAISLTAYALLMTYLIVSDNSVKPSKADFENFKPDFNIQEDSEPPKTTTTYNGNFHPLYVAEDNQLELYKFCIDRTCKGNFDPCFNSDNQYDCVIGFKPSKEIKI